jgi:hypothetical protein
MALLRVALFVACAAIVLIPGCSQAPNQAVAETRAALEAARKAGAEVYAPSQFKAAKVSYGLAMKEISAESRKLPFLRKYDKVIGTLKSAASAAKSAQAAVVTTKARITAETNDLLAQTTALADSIDAILQKAEKKQKDPGTIPAELDSVKIAAMSASNALGTGDLLLAKEKAIASHEKALEVKKAADELLPPRKVKTRKK